MGTLGEWMRTISAKRLGQIISPSMLPGKEGRSINGPSLIKVPDWAKSRLGRYYLYFAHHKGEYIRLAYSDSLEGPWSIYEPGTLRLSDCPFIVGHVASPDVHVDQENRRFIMYFHGPMAGTDMQRTFAATSNDGVSFDPIGTAIGRPYVRMFRHQGWHYGLFGAVSATLGRSRDGLSPFESGPAMFPQYEHQTPTPRHVAVQKLSEERLAVFYTRKGDAPEHIRLGHIDISKEWTDWRVDRSTSLLKPEKDYEGADVSLVPSARGISRRRENALRDPAIFEEDGRTWLVYAVAGESGIAIAELVRPGLAGRISSMFRK